MMVLELLSIVVHARALFHNGPEDDGALVRVCSLSVSNSGVRDCVLTVLSRLPTPHVDATHVTQPNTFLSRLPIAVGLSAPSNGMRRRWAVLLVGLTQHLQHKMTGHPS